MDPKCLLQESPKQVIEASLINTHVPSDCLLRLKGDKAAETDEVYSPMKMKPNIVPIFFFFNLTGIVRASFPLCLGLDHFENCINNEDSCSKNERTK
jgi:hypothetical protein